MFQKYIALGDSISIDSYPALDVGEDEGSPRGAASQLGKHLHALGIIECWQNLTEDGATCKDIADQINQVRGAEPDLRQRVIVTVTAGGNDISFAGMKAQGLNHNQYLHLLPRALRVVQDDYKDLIDQVLDRFPFGHIILNTLYDPTDGTRKLPNCGRWSDIVDWYSRGRRDFGEWIIQNYGHGQNNRVSVCDVFKLFDGHGMLARPNQRWYYPEFMIEPGYIGACALSLEWFKIIAAFLKRQEDITPIVQTMHQTEFDYLQPK